VMEGAVQGLGAGSPVKEQENCVFCRIVRGESPAEFLYKGQDVVVFKDIRPEAPVHLLVVPTRHIRSVNDLSGADKEILGEMFLRAKETAQELGIAARGYRLILNVERGGGQIVFHLHMHLLGGW
jgi:histidine triad (HIT) family protein